MNYNLDRFVKAQDGEYLDFPSIADAYYEISTKYKQSHWIWYVFPIFAGFGKSKNSQYFSIKSLDEAKEYISHPILGLRLKNMCKTLLIFKNKPLSYKIPVSIDREKIFACMTLFDIVSPLDIFGEMLNIFFEGKRHQLTLNLIEDYYV